MKQKYVMGLSLNSKDKSMSYQRAAQKDLVCCSDSRSTFFTKVLIHCSPATFHLPLSYQRNPSMSHNSVHTENENVGVKEFQVDMTTQMDSLTQTSKRKQQKYIDL